MRPSYSWHIRNPQETEDLHFDQEEDLRPRSTTKPSLTAFRVSSVVAFGAPVDLRRSVVLAALNWKASSPAVWWQGCPLLHVAAVFLLECSGDGLDNALDVGALPPAPTSYLQPQESTYKT